MANLTKLAKVVAITGAIGAISCGVYYASQSEGIQSAIDSLKAKAEAWKKQAGINKAQYNAMKSDYDTLKANYDAVLEILGINGAEDIETIKQKVQDIYNNADATGIEGTNNTLKAIAKALGVELTDADKNANGVYKTDKIMEELRKLDDELNNLQTALGNVTTDENGNITITINKNSSWKVPKTNPDGSVVKDSEGKTVYEEVKYSDDMSLSEKINFLIGQINKANDDQLKLKEYAEEANTAVDNASADYVFEENKGNEGETESAEQPTNPPTEEQQPTNPTNPPASETNAKAEAYGKLKGTAKTLADNGYEEGDIYASPSGNYYLYTFAKCAGAKDTLGLVDVSTSTPRYYSTALNINAQQVADLNAWARIPANN